MTAETPVVARMKDARQLHCVQTVLYSFPATNNKAHEELARAPPNRRLRAAFRLCLAPPPDVTTTLDADWPRRQEAINIKEGQILSPTSSTSTHVRHLPF
ncbi:hypothetical protein NDU88_002544 [Pleurodeles waltl]|uniref:Uncharacterized protein n=1 Tax=Pleurodeles waltl TaxID=8319 RepID=A0AAV7UA04_PLEWA|nr:hypothetical protein NDU88_002544 [Pleurodeles waltl]